MKFGHLAVATVLLIALTVPIGVSAQTDQDGNGPGAAPAVGLGCMDYNVHHEELRFGEGDDLMVSQALSRVAVWSWFEAL